MRFCLVAAFICLAFTPVKADELCEHAFFRPYYKTRSHFCVVGQQVTDYYSGEKILCEEAEVDHVVSLREAYRGGVCGEQLRLFANDPENLKLTHWQNNRRKGAARVEDFLSSNAFTRSSEAARLAEGIRGRYRIVDGEAAFAKAISDSALRKNAGKVVSTVAVNKMADLIEKRIGGRVLYFSGKRLVGVAARATGVASVVIFVPDAFTWLGRQSSAEIEVVRADYIRGLLE